MVTLHTFDLCKKLHELKPDWTPEDRLFIRREPENVKPVFPWSTRDGYFNGDMFEDWLNSTLDPDDPYLKLQRVIKAREASIYSQFVDDVRSLLKSLVLNRNRR